MTLLLICLLSVVTLLWLHWKVEALEAEQAAIHHQIYQQQSISTQDVSRGVDSSRQLQGKHGLYWYRTRAAVCAGLSGFAFACVGLERLKKWLRQWKR